MAEARGRFVRDSASVLAMHVVVTLIGIGTSVITARTLGPHDRGLFQLLILLPTTLCNFVKLGVPQANVYFMRREGAPAARVATNSLWLAVALGGALALVCWFGRDALLLPFMRAVPVALLLPVLALLPFALVQAFFLGLVQAQERFGEYNVQHVMPQLLGLIGMSVALLWLKTGLMGAVVTQTVVVVVVTVWLASRVYRSTGFGWRPDPGLMRGMLRFGGKSYLQTLASTLHFRVDQYMIGYFLEAGAVGLYAIAANLTGLLLKIADAAGIVVYPRLAGSGEQAVHAQTSAVCRHTLFATGLLALGMAVFGGLGIRVLYGQEYVGAIVPMLLMLPGVVMLALYSLLTRNFTSRNKQQVNIAAATAALGLNIALNCVLIPRFGIAGAAVSTAISYSAATCILLVVFMRESGYGIAQTLLVRRSDLERYLQLPGVRRLGIGTTAAE